MGKAMKIPRICHLVWSKGMPMSALQTLTVATFKLHNPKWETRLYLLHDVNNPNTYTPDYTGADYFDEAMPFIDTVVDMYPKDLPTWCAYLTGIQVSDVLRVWKLHEHGGVYSDFDMIWLKPMSAFKFDVPNATLCYHQNGHINQSIIVAQKGSPFMDYIHRMQAKLDPPFQHQAFNSDIVKAAVGNEATALMLYPDLTIIPYETFYPYSIYQLDRLYMKHDLEPLKAGPMGIHWFNGHKFSQEYVALDHFERDCSMSVIVKNFLA